MPEPHQRCADPSCHQTLAAHEDETVQTCSSFKVPAYGGAFEELATARRTVGQDGGKPIQVVHYSDARRAVTLAHEAGRAEGRAEGYVAAASRLDQDAEALEAWGAFDYLLLELAEEHGLDTEDLDPIQVVEALMARSKLIGRIS